MATSSRRTFLALTGVATAAAAAPLSAAPLLSAAAVAPARVRSGGQPVVAVVADAGTDEVALMVGEQEIVVHDAVLVDRLNAHLA